MRSDLHAQVADAARSGPDRTSRGRSGRERLLSSLHPGRSRNRNPFPRQNAPAKEKRGGKSINMSYFYAKRTQQSLIKPTIFMKRALLLFLAFTAAWLAGCDKQDDGPAPELTLSGGTEKTLATGGGSESVTFTTNTTWSASASEYSPMPVPSFSTQCETNPFRFLAADLA